MMYVDVVIPIKFRDSVTYSVPEERQDRNRTRKHSPGDGRGEGIHGSGASGQANPGV